MSRAACLAKASREGGQAKLGMAASDPPPMRGLAAHAPFASIRGCFSRFPGRGHANFISIPAQSAPRPSCGKSPLDAKPLDHPLRVLRVTPRPDPTSNIAPLFRILTRCDYICGLHQLFPENTGRCTTKLSRWLAVHPKHCYTRWIGSSRQLVGHRHTPSTCGHRTCQPHASTSSLQLCFARIPARMPTTKLVARQAADPFQYEGNNHYKYRHMKTESFVDPTGLGSAKQIR